MIKTTLLALALFATTAFGQLSYNIGVATDYVTRGTSQTFGTPAASVGVDYAHGPFYAGTWTSNVNFHDGTKREVDAWVGYTFKLSDVSVDLSEGFFGYLGAPVSYNMIETKLTVSRQFAALKWSNTVALSPDYFNVAGRSLWLESVLSYQLAKPVALSGSVARQIIYSGGSYSTYNVGVAYTLGRYTFDLRHSDTNRHDLGDLYRRALVLSLKAAF